MATDRSAPAYTQPGPYGALAPCCNDPNNRAVAALEPGIAPPAHGTLGVHRCVVCGRCHYTFTPETARRPRKEQP